MIFLIWFRYKVLTVLEQEFDYRPATRGLPKGPFNALTRHIRKLGGNEYDGAIAFMLVQAGALTGDSADAQAFIARVESIAASLMYRTILKGRYE